MPWQVIVAYAFVLGACLGSFLNVVIARLPAGESVVKPRSRCPRCGHQIAWYDNIPLVSFLWLRARCRACGARIAVRYFVVELLMASLTVALVLRLGLSWQLLVDLPICAALVAIAFLDIDHFWVPDVITYPAMLVAFAGSFLPGSIGPLHSLIGLAPALLLWGFAFLFERVTGREGMGLGDVKLLAVIGLTLGALPCLMVLTLGAVQGSIVGVLVIWTGGHRPSRATPEHNAGGEDEAKTDEVTPRTPEPPPEQPDKPVAEPTERAGAGDEDEWVPPPRAIPFGPFLVLGALEVILLPHVFGSLPAFITGLGASLP